MTNSLFDIPPAEFPSNESFPEGLTDLVLSDLQKAVLKLLAFIDYSRSKTEIKQLTAETITSLPAYRGVTKSKVNGCFDFFLESGFFVSYNRGGIGLQPEMVRKLLPLATSHKEFLRVAYDKEKDRGYGSNDILRLKLAILARDTHLVNTELFEMRYYFFKSGAERLWEALLELGDLSWVSSLIPGFDENFRYDFLNKLPFHLPYDFMEQWGSVLLSLDTEDYEEAVLNYLSCAHLILPRQEVVDISKKLGADPDSLFFSELLQGNTEKARMMASSWLQSIQEFEGHRRKELPGAFGILYAIVLLALDEPDQLSTAATFVRSAKKQLPAMARDSYNPFKQFAELLLLFIDHRTGKKRVDRDTVYHAYHCSYHQQFMTVVLSWLGKPLDNAELPPGASAKEEMEFRASGLMGSGETKAFSDKRLKELEKELDAIPLAGLMHDEEPWEVLLSALASAGGRKKASVTEKKSRLIWMVDPLNEYSLKVIEQTRNKTGWSKGKQRTLMGLLRKVPDFATPGDIRIINSLQKDAYYSRVSAKRWEDLLEALSVHPYLYSVSEPQLPIEIRIQEAQVQVDKKGEGASVKLNPTSPEVKVVRETPTRYICTKWSPRALRVYHLMEEMGVDSITIPVRGMKKARPLLDSLGEDIPVIGNLPTASVRAKKSANIPVLRLTPVEDQLHVSLLIEVLKDQPPLLVPGIGSSEIVAVTPENKKVNILRDREKEKEILAELADRIMWLREMIDSSGEAIIDDDRHILDFLADIKEKAPEVKVIWPKGERFRITRVLSYADISLNLKQNQDWFELGGEVHIADDLKFSIRQLLDRSQGGSLKYIQLSDVAFIALQKDLQKRLASLNAVVHEKGKKLEVHPLGAGTLEGLIKDVPGVKTDKHWKAHIAKLESLKSYEPEVPGNLQAQLRPYQVEGILWLDRLHEWGVGGCLADDMGLGKTLQAIAILLKYARNGPGLVIAPSSVCANWGKEIVRFAPALRPQILNGRNRESTLGKLSEYDVMIVSYGLLQSNPDLLATRQWNVVVLDEAHAIKNARSVRSKAVMKLKANFRILTTGTPIQNHLGELWNLFQFMNPGMLGTQEQFLKKYGNGKGIPGSELNHKVQNRNLQNRSAQDRSALNRYIAPFILRRNKNDVLDDLPGKTEITLHISLSEQERAMYEVLREKAIENINGSDQQGGTRHMQILSEITKLRQMSCNPLLVAPDSKLGSSKLEALETLIDNLLKANHRALIFSQFTKHLALIRDMLDDRGWSYQYLDGSTPVKKREGIIRDFQNGESELFLISLKAGGSGLNLTAADYVIHMDPWWNPAVEDQASDRAHRIGQTRPVTIYRLIAENTIEEKIVKMHHEKRDLAEKLLTDTDQSAKISSEELFNLIAGEN